MEEKPEGERSAEEEVARIIQTARQLGVEVDETRLRKEVA